VVKLRLGTRGSPLALTQAQEVSHLLKSVHPGLELEIIKIKTTGDRISEWNSSSEEQPVGAFVRELEAALLSGEIDAAVHSLKDLPSEIPEALEIAAVLPRRNPADALLTRDRLPLSALPRAARIGTGSLRRQVQVLSTRPDLTVLPLRGNVDTRIRKLKNGEYDGIIAACAGLERLGLSSEITEVLSLSAFIPAVGQGAIGLEIRKDDGQVCPWLEPLNHRETRVAVEAERGFLHRLGVGCRAPAAALARIEASGKLVIAGMVSDPEGRVMARGEKSGSPGRPAELGITLAEELLAKVHSDR
jgi:hydroxymethylbilane synthase